DPLAFRLSRITQHPRMHAVLKRVGEMANWSKPRPEGTGLGVGVFEEWGSVAAQVAEVSVANDTLTIHKIWAAVDCGRVVSPDTVRAQTESGIHCGLSAALMGKITLENGQATQSNFDTYPVMDLTRSPEIEVALMDSDLPPGGVGEIGTPATAPAVTNAIFAAIGKRIRTLPINLHMGV
ncbi:MAG: molybdopterin cofactor-binding domain-containing protein, partial [Pseudomonadota bacterium]